MHINTETDKRKDNEGDRERESERERASLCAVEEVQGKRVGGFQSALLSEMLAIVRQFVAHCCSDRRSQKATLL